MGATVVIITHKVSLLSNVDKLLVIQDGAMVAFGPREGILKQLQQKLLQQRGKTSGKAIEAPSVEAGKEVARG